MKLFDIHSHVLPGMDDGPASMEESLALLALAEQEGIRTVIATPHESEDFPHQEPDAIRAACRELEEEARRKIHPDFRILPGQEIAYCEGVTEKLKRGELLTLGDTSCVLLEFPSKMVWSELNRVLRNLMFAGYTPILAHMERYHALRKEGRPEELLEAGVLMQMNYAGAAGPWYDRDVRWCRRMLAEGVIHFLGTDMHGVDYRPPRTADTRRWLLKHLGESETELLCGGNAERMLREHRV